MPSTLTDPYNQTIFFRGANLEEGPLPAFFYFSLSGKESLELHPYNQPVILLSNCALRTFSFTLPSHEEGLNPFHAMDDWAERMNRGEKFLESFFEKTVGSIHWLLEKKMIDPEKIAIGGLSRGAFIATHIAARLTHVTSVIGFAPLTQLMYLKEFKKYPSLEKEASQFDLIQMVDRLTHIKQLRFYIGNRDTRVDTDACYQFIRSLAEKNHEKKIRNQKIELIITSSIGHKGHGTAPHIFEEAAAWIKESLS